MNVYTHIGFDDAEEELKQADGGVPEGTGRD